MPYIFAFFYETIIGRDVLMEFTFRNLSLADIRCLI